MPVVVIIPFYLPIKSLLLKTKCVFKHQDLQIFSLILNKYELFFTPFEVVDRGSKWVKI